MNYRCNKACIESGLTCRSRWGDRPKINSQRYFQYVVPRDGIRCANLHSLVIGHGCYATPQIHNAMEMQDGPFKQCPVDSHLHSR